MYILTARVEIRVFALADFLFAWKWKCGRMKKRDIEIQVYRGNDYGQNRNQELST